MTTRRITGPALSRLPRRPDAFMVPRAVVGEPGRFVVDGTWGTLNPMVLAPGVRTVGELEVVAHLESSLPVIDSRLPEYFAAATIPGARSLPHVETAERAGELSRTLDTVLFCNGPQCAATPDAVRRLLEAGHPPERLLYYRGGMHDWMTLGLPSAPGDR